jgi:beta-lactamase class A
MRTASLAVLSALVGWLVVAIALTIGDDREPAALEVSAASPASATAPNERRRPPTEAAPRAPRLPSAAAIAAASRFATTRGGEVAFAALGDDGELRGRSVRRTFSAASTVKAMLLAAELQRLEREGLALDDETAGLLEAMITISDNEAADAIYARSGDPGMLAVARQAEMADFTVAGDWGNAQVSAADLASLFAHLERVLPERFRVFGLGLLGSVTPEQSWGIPQAAHPRWAVRFKGGWLPDRGLVHQAAQLRQGDRELAIAVLTDGQLSFEHATETVRGIAARLLSPSDRERGA